MPSRREHYLQQDAMAARSFYQPRAEFPWFDDADTLVIITGARQYKLHSSILRRSSPKLKDLLDEDHAAKLSKAAIKKGVTIRYRMVLQMNDYDEDDSIDAYEFELVELNDAAQPVDGRKIPLDLENGRVVPPHIKAFEQILAAFYSQPLELGTADGDGLRTIMERVDEIVKVAESLRCVPIITKPIEAAYLACGQTLWQAISREPVVWLEFANRIKSRPLFREALVHIAGKFNTTEVKRYVEYECKDEKLKDLVISKGRALLEGSKHVQAKIQSYYPTHLQREKTLGRADVDGIGRAAYANDIYSWMALTCFRQWVTQIVTDDLTHHAEDMGFEYFKAVSKGGEAYMTREELSEFGERFPTSIKGTNVLASKITEIKDNVKKFVLPLLENYAELDIKQHPVGYMTCTFIDPGRDYPWEQGEVEKEANRDDESDLFMSEG